MRHGKKFNHLGRKKGHRKALLTNLSIALITHKSIAEKVATRPGGYCRIIKTGVRKGDSAEMAMIELVDFNELMLANKSATTKKKRSRRGGGKKAAAATTATVAAKAIKSEEE